MKAHRTGSQATYTRIAVWEYGSAEEALGRLLKEHGLAMVANPATSIARIAFTNQAITPLPPGAVGGSTNPVIPLVSMDEVPLDLAIQNLAAQAHLRLALDASLPLPSPQPAGRAFSRPTVSVRWKNVTARQALTALLDNYSLLLVEDSATGSAKIVAKAPDSGRQIGTGEVVVSSATPAPNKAHPVDAPIERHGRPMASNPHRELVRVNHLTRHLHWTAGFRRVFMSDIAGPPPVMSTNKGKER